MDKTKLNRLRRMAGAPCDYSADPRKVTSLVEDGIPGISQIFRGGDKKFYLVCDADNKEDLGDVLTELDFPALVNILKTAKDTSDWELFPHSEKNKALDLARKRLATATVTETIGSGADNPDNTPYPSDEELDNAVSGRDFDDVDDDDFEPDTNICPDCEGGIHPPSFGVCERCNGEGEIFESNKPLLPKQKEVQKKIDAESKKQLKKPKQAGTLAAKTDREEEEEVKTCSDCKCDPCECKEEEEEEKDNAALRNLKKGREKRKTKVKDHSGVGAGKSRDEKEEEEEVKTCKCGCDPAKCKCDADCKCGCNAKEKVKEDYQNVLDVKPQQAADDYQMTNDTNPVKVPAKVLSELKRAIKEVTAESKKALPRDHARSHYYEDTAEALQIVHDFLGEKTVQGLKQAQIYVNRMANVSRHLIPDVVWKFIVNGGETRSLSSYYKEVKVKDPVNGKPFGNVGITQLNKNTHTE